MPCRRVAFLGSLLALASTGCGSCSRADAPAPSGSEEAAASALTTEEDDAGADDDGIDGDASTVARGGRHLRHRSDASAALAPLDAACRGESVDLVRVLFDERCAVDRVTAARLLGANGATKLEQRAEVEEGGAVVVTLVNAGPKGVTLPLSYHERLPAFSALALDEAKNLFELVPPRFARPTDSDAGAKARFARVFLPPGGRARATVIVSPVVVRRIAPKCEGDAASCAPSRLAPGRYSLHVGQLLADVAAGPPAVVPWTSK